MESKNELKETNIKDHTCDHFDDISKIEDFDLGNILIDEKLHENILICNILYKRLIHSKPLRIRCNKIDGFIEFMMGLYI